MIMFEFNDFSGSVRPHFTKKGALSPRFNLICWFCLLPIGHFKSGKEPSVLVY